ncbi:MAG: hypothetical protein ACNYWU_05030 [Desulfobacterales bacterium]
MKIKQDVLRRFRLSLRRGLFDNIDVLPLEDFLKRLSIWNHTVIFAILDKLNSRFFQNRLKLIE